MDKAAEELQYRKMTETPVAKLIGTLAIPTILTMLVSNIYNLVDTAFVGLWGNSASGAVGVVFGFMAILQAVGYMFGQGAGSLAARKLGARDIRAASVISSTGFFSALIIGAVLEVVCLFLLRPLVFFLGSTATIAPYAETYIFYILLAAPFTIAGFTLNIILRYEGKAFYGMIGLVTGAVLNIGGDAVLMLGFDLGITGAGISTAVSQVISFVILLIPFLRGKTESRLSIRSARFSPRLEADLITTGLPSLLRQGLNSINTVLLNNHAAVYGDAAVAAMSIVARIGFFVFSVALGVGQGFQPVCSFNYGAKKYSRVRRGYFVTLIMAEVLMVIINVIVMLNTNTFVRLFRDDDLVCEIAAGALILQCIGQMVLPVCMVTEMTMQSSGKKVGAVLLSAFRSGAFFIPALIILAYFFGLAGIQWAQPAAFIFSLLPSVLFASYYFRHLPKEEHAS